MFQFRHVFCIDYGYLSAGMSEREDRHNQRRIDYAFERSRRRLETCFKNSNDPESDRLVASTSSNENASCPQKGTGIHKRKASNRVREILDALQHPPPPLELSRRPSRRSDRQSDQSWL